MKQPYTLYSWEVSYFGGKIRSYLRQKGIAFNEIRPTLWGYYVTLPRRTRTTAIPVVVTPQGEWLQDSSAIIDALEARHPAPSVLPSTPLQAFAAHLFEIWGDEFWLPTGLHTRWCHMADNYDFLERDVADNLLPGWPRPLQKRAVAKVASRMANYLQRCGVVPAQYELLHRWTVQQLDWLDAHFATTPYLLGERPSLGDFGLMAPLYGHLSRDPWPARHLIEPRPHLKAWIARMNQAGPVHGSFTPDDRLPDTLQPLLRAMLSELLPYCEGNLMEVRQRMAQAPTVKAMPRFLGDIAFPMLDGHYRRPAMPYVLWMVQRMLDAVRAMTPPDALRIRLWLRQHGAERLLDLDLPRLRRAGLCAALDD